MDTQIIQDVPSTKQNTDRVIQVHKDAKELHGDILDTIKNVHQGAKYLRDVNSQSTNNKLPLGNKEAVKEFVELNNDSKELLSLLRNTGDLQFSSKEFPSSLNLARVDSSSPLCWSQAQEKREGWKPHFCKTTHTQNPQRKTTHRHQPRNSDLFKFFRGRTPGLIAWANQHLEKHYQELEHAQQLMDKLNDYQNLFRELCFELKKRSSPNRLPAIIPDNIVRDTTISSDNASELEFSREKLPSSSPYQDHV
nr:unnamed protein product [Callosobruchus chinensis]